MGNETLRSPSNVNIFLKEMTLERLKSEILSLNNGLSEQLFRENIHFAEKFI